MKLLLQKQQDSSDETSILLLENSNNIRCKNKCTKNSLIDSNNISLDDDIHKLLQNKCNVIELNNNEVNIVNENDRKLITRNRSSDEENDDYSNIVTTRFDSGFSSNIMGSNVSRYSDKGLSGRRAQSSGIFH